MRFPSLPRAARLDGVPLFVLSVSLLFTAVAVWYVHGSISRAREARFDRAVLAVVTQTARRLDGYVNVLYSTGGFIAATDDTDRDGFSEYLSSINLEQRYPGIQAIGFSKVVRESLDEFEAEWRAAGIEDFRVWPRDPRPVYTAIVMIEPQDPRNLAAVGYDMMSNPVRHRAMSQARDTGSAAISGRVSLVQEITEDRQHGFLVYVPVYLDPYPSTVLERRERLLGFAYGAFRTADFFGEAVDISTLSPIRFEVYDGLRPDPEALLYQSADRAPDFIPPAKMTRSIALDVPGRSWTVVIEAAPGMVDRSERAMMVWTGVVGGLLSLVLWLSTGALARERHVARTRAVELRKSQDELRESQSKIRRLLDANIIGVMTIGEDGTIEAVNDAFLRILGYTRDEPMKGELNLRELIDPAHARYVDMAGDLSDGRSDAAIETTIVGNDGARVPVLLGLAPLEPGSGDGIGFIVDIRDRKRAEQERDRLLERERELRAAAEAANVAKDEFLATLSHELRTPMTAILGWSKMLDAPGVEEEMLKQGIESIRRSALVQAQLIDDLLDVSRIMVGKLRLTSVELDLRGTVEAAIDSLRQSAVARGLELKVHLPEEPVLVGGDPARLQQVILNLLSNAIKFTSAGEVSLTLRTEEESAVLTVQDTGIGIEPEFLPHVFDRFRQADATSTRAHGGLGLGLSIVKTIVELHGGRVAVHSEGRGKGSRFTVALPLASAGTLRTAESSRPRAVLRRDALSGLAILLVEDNLEVRQMVEVTLRRLGAAVTPVGSVDEALHTLRVQSFDVIVSDITMPRRDGFDLIRELKRATLPSTSETPAIALTAHAGEEFRERLLAAGYSAVVEKPVEAERLAAEILEVRQR